VLSEKRKNIMTDYELTKKFAQNFHLNVADRRSLHDGKIRGFVLSQAIGDIVEECGKYPSTWDIARPFDGGLIEKVEAGHYKLTWKSEVGVCRFETISTTDFIDLDTAATEVAKGFFKSSFDGISIEWADND
jgi:hypothetical protein